MKATGVHHVAIVVDDVEAALEFYRLLGCRVAPRPDFGKPGYWLQVGGQQIHLIGSDDRPAASLAHFALAIDDAREAVAELTRAGYRVREIPYTPGAGHQVVTWDPAGNTVELNQPDGVVVG